MNLLAVQCYIRQLAIVELPLRWKCARLEAGDCLIQGKVTFAGCVDTDMEDGGVFKRASLTGLEPRTKGVIPEILPPEAGTARVVRTVLFADLVESVRLMQEDEAGTVQRWRAFVHHVVHQRCPVWTAAWSRASATV